MKTTMVQTQRRQRRRGATATSKGDLATPITWTRTAAERMRKRRQRSATCPAGAFPWNDACRMAIKSNEPNDKALRYIWRIVKTPTWPCPPSSAHKEHRRPCHVCRAPLSRWCVLRSYVREENTRRAVASVLEVRAGEHHSRVAVG